MQTRLILAAGVALAATSDGARAQEVMHTAAATMPSPASLILRPQFHYAEYGRNPHTGDEKTIRYEWTTSLQVGLYRELSLTAELPVIFETRERPGDDDDDYGVSDIDLTLKWRFFRKDSQGVDTIRAALLAGAAVASGDDDDFSTQSVNPFLGGVVTVIRGRHGFNQDLIYTLTTGGEEASNFGGQSIHDALAFNSAYVFRLFPAEYSADTHGSLYATIELNGLYETNGDTELLWAPGLMYEARRFAVEVMVQLPLWQDVRERPELDLRVGIGLRFLF